MRNVNVVKYRKLLQELQYFCKCAKKGLWRCFESPIGYHTHHLTDYERGYIAGQHGAYNDILRELNARIFEAEYDWNSIHCREEINSN